MSTTTGPFTIDIQKLRQVLIALFDHVESTEGPLIDVGRDHYWILELSDTFSEDLDEPGTESSALGVGKISDDVETVNELAKEIEKGEPFFNPWHDLEHAVGLLRALAWKDLP